MARRPRGDAPGTWHHVVNRAIAKRPYFETRSDKRYFLAQLAREVRSGRIEVHAFCLMTTHYHLLARSPLGELSEAMRRAQCSYSRHFNRRRRRDGPLIRARFFSKRVETESYRRAVVRYIDANAPRAGLVGASADHEFGSARAYLVGPRPRWLSTEWVESCAVELSGSSEYDSAAYLKVFGSRSGENLESLCQLVESRMRSAREVDPLDDLIGATPRQVQEWMHRKALLADGLEVGLPICGAAGVMRAVDREVDRHGEWLIERDAGTWRGSQVASIGLLRDLCAVPVAKVAQSCRSTDWRVKRQGELHRLALGECADYRARVARIVQDALEATIPR